MVSKWLKTHYLRSYDQFLKNGFTIVFLAKKGGPENAILATERALTAVMEGEGEFYDVVASIICYKCFNMFLENPKRFE